VPNVRAKVVAVEATAATSPAHTWRQHARKGRQIYFNSDRTGRMQLWWVWADGTGQEQLTDDEYNNWFPHPRRTGRRWCSSPTGRG
jgi:Tol biopolymer transport system component